MSHTIYKLIDPDTKQVRYIGYTSQELHLRVVTHLMCIRTHKKRKNHSNRITWLTNLLKQGKIPIIKAIRIVKEEEWEKWEIYYIKKYRGLNHPLLNISSGGKGGRHGGRRKSKIRPTKEEIKALRKFLANLKKRNESK